MQQFKDTDLLEKKVNSVILPILEEISADRSAFIDGAYECYLLGDVFFDLDRAPLADAVSRETFRRAFYAICKLFTRPGTFTFYIQVIKAVWGDSVEIEFEIPSPGVLNININALTIEKNKWMARKIIDNAYQYSEVKTRGGANIVFQGRQGIKSQSEADALMWELYPAGVIVSTSLITT